MLKSLRGNPRQCDLRSPGGGATFTGFFFSGDIGVLTGDDLTVVGMSVGISSISIGSSEKRSCEALYDELSLGVVLSSFL